ncbi:NADH-quinone oxidoreductase subunit G [Helicobacter sp. 11S02629-2]|uniref:NADH-quinone oxidoreductase subunit G n=1 Tax=Helicobacter sp. 11S02629-2 TaxID=1476195 RepID=UPI000BA72C23|nr:NADH-quinone oxidoreductase subunit G [Helicobacter sp. 11S02629-2]PAF44921.1 hypothetical protein BKH40_04330 [Helicobacter sp. 11S02629-2]
MIKIIIDSIECECEEGETVLEIARKHNIQIPSICYLSECSPTLACKMCMVEIDGKRTYSCNAKAKDGMNILSNTEEIIKDRTAIMQTYCVNHPLECGVCDKSGECELQDFTLYTKVPTQEYGLKESDKKGYRFAQSTYDPNLCIMCERCATTCKDNIGYSNLKAGKAKLFTPESYKETMPKDPYSVWSKKQKGLIEFVGESECKDCGECISACPVGAMTYTGFTYTSNAWELEKIDSACSHCPSGCFISYNMKVNNHARHLVYRVQNDYHYNPICGAGRFSYDTSFYATSNIKAISLAVDSLQKATSLHIGSDVTNEEAYLFSKIATKLNIPLFNTEAYRLKTLLGHIDSKNFASFVDYKVATSFVSINSLFKYINPSIKFRINNNLKLKKTTKLLSFAPFIDKHIASLGKGVRQIESNLSDTLAILLALCKANDIDYKNKESLEASSFIPEEVKEEEKAQKEKLEQAKLEALNEQAFKDSKEEASDLKGTSPQETNKEETNKEAIKQDTKVEELPNLEAKFLEELKLEPKGILLLSEYSFDGLDTKSLSFASYLLNLLCSKLDLKVMVSTLGSNTLGVANLCKLSKESEVNKDYVVGIRASGDYMLQSLALKSLNSEPNFEEVFPLPFISQVDGSFTNVEHRVLRLSPGSYYEDSKFNEGSYLDSIANFFDIKCDCLSDFTKDLHTLNPAYKDMSYADFKLRITKSGEDVRGYFLDYKQEVLSEDSLAEVVLPKKLDFNALLLNPKEQFNIQTKHSAILQTKVGIYISKEYAAKLELNEGKDVVLLAKEDDKQKVSLKAKVYIDYDLEGEIFLVSPLLDGIESLFQSSKLSTLVLQKDASIKEHNLEEVQA